MKWREKKRDSLMFLKKEVADFWKEEMFWEEL